MNKSLTHQDSEGRVRINLTKLTVVVDTPSNTIPLSLLVVVTGPGIS